MQFASQWDGSTFNPNFGTPIQSINGTPSLFDFNAGIFYSGQLVKKLTVYGGFSYYHIGEPNQSVYTGQEFSLPSRTVVHGGLDWQVSKRVSLLPGVIYMSQAKAKEVNFGTNLGFMLSDRFGKEIDIFAGLWYRANDGVIPMIAFELMKRLRIGFSYDVNTSSLNVASNSKGAYEISLIYIGRILKPRPINLFCPRF